ncbi:VanZ family protein [Amycolatopsis sp. cmx-4-61]|uniref:VanZ family protein n=1 Tax=Amycolatopsis sp. cmx-4-61 TaxID=2790937 RepID=UPI00397AD143
MLLFLPYIARQYRRRGQLGLGHTALSFAALVSAVAVITYTLLPLPELTPDFCSRYGYGAQWRPFQFVADMVREQRRLDLHGATGVFRNPALQVRMFNVALFVPLGMFFRHLFHLSIRNCVAAGFLVSAFVELTQLTGVWFLYPCAYRHFDVDDLIANSAGAALGAMLAPVLRLVPGQYSQQPPDQPREVTTSRRWLGMLCDVWSFWLLGTVFAVLSATSLSASPTQRVTTWDNVVNATVSSWLPGLLLFVLVPVTCRGATLGQQAVMLRPSTVEGGTPSTFRTVLRTGCGLTLYATLTGLSALGLPTAGLANFVLLIHGVAVLFTRNHRGLSCALAGLQMNDARTSLRALRSPPAEGVLGVSSE